MSDRASFRGGRGHSSEHRGGRGGGARGGPHGHGGGREEGKERERPKKENILDLGRYLDKEIAVRFNGGREVTGILKGYDQLMNLVLDDVKETLRDEENNTTTRSLGLIVARGTLLVLISPLDGSEEIANPFAMDDGEEGGEVQLA
ncbi:U6 snRNA-associated Sm-like protein LSm7 [Patellaria atrata CBS 101060]|uniref:U6 snRNA-associated Sm-like protein LSm7 n=1 Tax=Patellaria atrata CBS 101060 TaxID=1346257 RepID=A0A9P4SJQ6_9PEZI|nr:U6 snRNA-associated Sm-like protein LSm7 [Patellaria atrata CBS 101060]